MTITAEVSIFFRGLVGVFIVCLVEWLAAAQIPLLGPRSRADPQVLRMQRSMGSTTQTCFKRRLTACPAQPLAD
jgi:hypothetical protein